MSRTPNGYLRGDAHVTRVGVLTYRRADGTEHRELRPPEEVFAQDSLDSFAGLPVTLEHPPGAVTPENVKALAVGALGDSVRADGRFVRASVVVHDAAAIKAVESRSKREVSCGYTCDLDETPGVWNGERYDAVQRNIRGNHLAIVTRGRAGPDVALRLDSADAVCVDPTDDVADDAVTPEAQHMTVKIKIDAVDYEVSEQAAQAFAAHEAKHAGDLAKAQARADQLEADLAKARADADPAKLGELVAARVALEGAAGRVLGSEFKADGKSDDEIRRAVIAKVAPEAKLDGRSPEYVAARFDAALESADAAAKVKTTADASANTARVAATTAKTDAAPETAEAARERMIARNRAAFTKAGA